MQRMKARQRYWEWGREPTSFSLLRTSRTSPTSILGSHCPPQSTLICWWQMTSDHLSFTGLHLNLNGGWNWGPSWPFWHSTIPHMRWGESRRRRITPPPVFQNLNTLVTGRGTRSCGQHRWWNSWPLGVGVTSVANFCKEEKVLSWFGEGRIPHLPHNQIIHTSNTVTLKWNFSAKDEDLVSYHVIWCVVFFLSHESNFSQKSYILFVSVVNYS